MPVSRKENGVHSKIPRIENLRPSKETLIHFCLILDTLLVFIILLMIFPKPEMHCLPFYWAPNGAGDWVKFDVLNSTFNSAFTKPQAEFINNLCNGRHPTNYLQIYGILAVVIGTFMWICFEGWTYHPKIVASLVTFWEIDDIIGKLTLKPEELERMLSRRTETVAPQNMEERKIQQIKLFVGGIERKRKEEYHKRAGNHCSKRKPRRVRTFVNMSTDHHQRLGLLKAQGPQQNFLPDNVDHTLFLYQSLGKPTKF
uniref:uncharacterized protein LOC120341543 n=1 Tax=Styela clava TaxID=7725 RepID=UPI0019393FD6|nr:uncharacterized protein LOC120341543 [Styela clava]